MAMSFEDEREAEFLPYTGLDIAIPRKSSSCDSSGTSPSGSPVYASAYIGSSWTGSSDCTSDMCGPCSMASVPSSRRSRVSKVGDTSSNAARGLRERCPVPEVVVKQARRTKLDRNGNRDHVLRVVKSQVM